LKTKLITDCIEMENEEIMGQLSDTDRLGQIAVQALALLGGLAGLIIAAFYFTASEIGSSSSHMAWGGISFVAGFVFLLFGAGGISSALLYTRYRKPVAWILLFSGLLGFPLGYVAWSNWIGFFGWVTRIPAGVLLTWAGILAVITPERLRSGLLGQESSLQSKADVRSPIDQAVFVGAILAGIGLLTVIFLISGFLVFGAEDSLKDDAARDQEDFDNAALAASMGRWDKSIESYDAILARNQSNPRAWTERAYALEKLGRQSEAEQSYEIGRKLDAQNREMLGADQEIENMQGLK
jgi:hypothetical protein